MKGIILLVFTALISVSCNNFKMEELYGTWTSNDIEFTFNEDKTMNCRLGALNEKGRYRPFGNTLEIINTEEKVLTRVTIKSLKNDSLIIDLPNFSSNIYTLVRK